MGEGEAERLIKAPNESLTLELKAWLDLKEPEHKAKLVRAFLALRNYNGGYVVIGFDDETGNPSPNPPSDPRAAYRGDDLQRLVATYASDPFGIETEHPKRDGVAYPVIKIRPGCGFRLRSRRKSRTAGAS